jgi:hypothetical protein
MVVRHDGGGGDRFRRVSVGVVVGSDEGGGCSGHFGSGSGAPGGSARVHTGGRQPGGARVSVRDFEVYKISYFK